MPDTAENEVAVRESRAIKILPPPLHLLLFDVGQHRAVRIADLPCLVGQHRAVHIADLPCVEFCFQMIYRLPLFSFYEGL